MRSRSAPGIRASQGAPSRVPATHLPLPTPETAQRSRPHPHSRDTPPTRPQARRPDLFAAARSLLSPRWGRGFPGRGGKEGRREGGPVPGGRAGAQPGPFGSGPADTWPRAGRLPPRACPAARPDPSRRVPSAARPRPPLASPLRSAPPLTAPHLTSGSGARAAVKPRRRLIPSLRAASSSCEPGAVRGAVREAPCRLRRSGTGGASGAPRLTKLRHRRGAPIYRAAGVAMATHQLKPAAIGWDRAGPLASRYCDVGGEHAQGAPRPPPFAPPPRPLPAAPPRPLPAER